VIFQRETNSEPVQGRKYHRALLSSSDDDDDDEHAVAHIDVTVRHVSKQR
jgi:hypothetical protein